MMRLETWPRNIWLQHSEDRMPVPEYRVGTDEITWCEDQQHDNDIEYVRADFHLAVVDQLNEARDRLQAEIALRPRWAQGYTDDSVAAQTSTNALYQLWELLGATNQTEAAEIARKLKAGAA